MAEVSAKGMSAREREQKRVLKIHMMQQWMKFLREAVLKAIKVSLTRLQGKMDGYAAEKSMHPNLSGFSAMMPL